ncbi:MAG: DUF4143 domain-containing protein [Cellulosilyticaceae bacterium]
MKNYYKRIADDLLEDKLRSSGAVLIKGPKWCGKSTTAEKHSKSVVYMQNIRERDQNIELAKNAPDLFLQGETPRLIDEWQVIPFIWDQVRFEVDHRENLGQFIMTGSAMPIDNEAYSHSGVGRIVPMMMRPMTLHESLDSNGTISLSELFNNNLFQSSKCDLSLQDYAYLICRGGWPQAIGLEREIALEQVYNFYDGLINDDINRVFKRAKNPERIKRLMKSYSRAIASSMLNTEIKKDMLINDEETLDEDTIASYINALNKLFIIEELPAWNPNLRSKTAIRTSNTRHFVDPSIACAALGLGPADLINDLKTFGLFFESMCVRDLRVFTDNLKGQVYHYRDKSGLEADAIIHLRNGEWAAVEVKLTSQESIEEGAKHLLQLAESIDTSKMKRPTFLLILTATQYAYKRDDGVYVVPIGCLRD